MAIPSYTTDLQLFSDFETATTFGEFTGFTAGRTQAVDSDFPIQGNQCASAILAVVGAGSTAVDFGSNITWTSGWNFFMWGIFLAPAAIATQAAQGKVMMIGSTVADFRRYDIGGSDVDPYPYGGWTNVVANPEVTPSATVGTPGTAYRWVGIGHTTVSAVAKGSPQGVDVIRYGRGELRIAGGQTGNYANFSGSAAYNDDDLNRLGLLQKIDGGYRWKGLLYLGFGAATEFVDSNKSIVISNTQFVLPTFNKIEVHNAASIIDWTNISITALGTVSKGQFEVIDNASVHMDACTFTDMDSFKFRSNSHITGSTFRRCGVVYQSGSTFQDSLFTNTTAVSALSGSNPTLVIGTEFISDGSSHAYEITTAGEYSWTNNIVTNYATANGTTGNEVIYNVSQGAVIINVSGGSGTVSYRNLGASTTTINNTVAVTLTGLKELTEVRVLAQGTNTELAGIEIATDGSVGNRSFTFSLTAATAVDIVIHSLAYVHLRISNYIVPSSAASLPVAQQFDRNYLNPTP